MNMINTFVKHKKLLMIIILFLLGIVLIVGSRYSEKNELVSNNDMNMSSQYYSDMIEDRIEEFLLSVNGISNARVFVTIEAGDEYEYAKIENSGGFVSDYLVIKNDSGEEPAVIRQIYPIIRGVGVCCTGGEKSNVKKEVTTLLSAALGISSNKIEVAGYK